MDNIYLSAFGGSGENGRNCYTIGIGEEFLLLDCGVKLWMDMLDSIRH